MNPNDFKRAFRKATTENIPEYNRQAKENIRLATVTEISNTLNSCSVRVIGTGEQLATVRIPRGTVNISVGDTAVIICPDIKNSLQNYILGTYNSQPSFIDYRTSTINDPNIIGGTWQSFTPSWTNLTIGSATVEAAYKKVGKTVNYRVSITFAADTSISGEPIFSLPVPSITYSSTVHPIGTANLRDTGTTSYMGYVFWATTTTAKFVVQRGDLTYTNIAGISSTIPMTWTTGDIILAFGCYEAA